MDCSTYSSPLHHADCKLIEYHVPEACILIVVISFILAAWKMVDRDTDKSKIKTEAPWMWRLAAWTVLLPGTYFNITTFRFTVKWTSESWEEPTPKDDPAWPFLLFLSIVLAYVATIALAIGLFCLWVGFLDALGNAPTQALKAKDEEQGIPLPEISGGIDEDAAAPPYAPKTAVEAPAAGFSEDAAQWALSPKEEGGEDGSKGATLMNTSSSESQPTKGEEHFNLASQTPRPVDEHAAALPDESSTPWAAVVAETAEYALSSDSDEEDDNSDSYDYATASPGEPSTGQDPWAAVVYEAADLALASDEKKQQEKEGDDNSEANKHAATPQEEPSAQEEPSSAVMFEATEYHVPCVGEEEADDSSDATLLTPSSSEREWAAEESNARSAVREDETAKASGDSSNERTSVRGSNNQSRRAGHLRVVAPSQNSTRQSRKTRQEDRICAQQ